MLWALTDALRRQGLHIQPFFSTACFSEYRKAAAFSGTCPRHLDAWLMTPELSREWFLRGAGPCDLAIVEGEFGQRDAAMPDGSLEPLCEWLELPRLVVLDASRSGDSLPNPPEQVDGVLIDCIQSDSQLTRMIVQIETHWEVPVLGALELSPSLRAELGSMAMDGRPNKELRRALGNQFLRSGEPERVVEIASRRPVTWEHPHLFDEEPFLGNVTIALAYDDALNCYFPNTLDLLELYGATIVDFSPLRDASLPKADIVYLGSGHPEEFASELAANECMRLALRNHLRQGGRIYAEGGGAAYLCQQMETEAGAFRMVGILPAIAHLSKTAQPPSPVAFTTDKPCWMGPAGTSFGGYLEHRWQLEPAGDLIPCGGESSPPYALVKSGLAVGSRMQIDFAAQPHLMPTFLRCAAGESEAADPWRI